MLQAPLLLAAWGALTGLHGDAAGTLDVSNRSEVRVRDTESSPPTTPNPSLDLADTITARIGLKSRQWTYTLGYSIAGTLPDVEQPSALAPLVLQSADTGLTWSGRRASLGVAEYVSYGFTNTATTGAAPAVTGGTAPAPPGVTTLATPATLQFVASRDTASSPP
jgi:hypothetical protein